MWGKLPQPDHGVGRLDRLEVERGEREFERPERRRPGGARVRQVHARQRGSQLPGPVTRRRLRLRGARLIARVKGAQAKCRKLLPGGGPPALGSKTHPSAQTLGKLLKIAECMRTHGVPQFPDPRTSVPSNPVGIREITDFDDAILLFPSTINMQAPAYRQALTACGAPPLGLRH